MRSTTHRSVPRCEPCSTPRPRDLGVDPSGPEFATVLVVVIAAVGEEPFGPAAWPTNLAAHRSDGIDERQQLGDVIAVAAGQRDRQRHPGGVGDQVVLGTGAATIDRRRPGGAPPCNARIWLPSTTEASQSIRPAALR